MRLGLRSDSEYRRKVRHIIEFIDGVNQHNDGTFYNNACIWRLSCVTL